jgi:Aminotransferase class I and II
MSLAFGEYNPLEALTGSMRDFRDLHGSDLLGRVENFYLWQELRRRHGLWPYSKSTEEAPRALCTAKDDSGKSFHGLNFSSQDYLGLSSDLEIKEAAKAVIDEYGVHSAGSSALSGNTKYSLMLEKTISDFLRLDHTVLYPTGWAAGYGVIKALVGPADHVVLDGLSHACLQEGASAATSARSPQSPISPPAPQSHSREGCRRRSAGRHRELVLHGLRRARSRRDAGNLPRV